MGAGLYIIGYQDVRLSQYFIFFSFNNATWRVKQNLKWQQNQANAIVGAKAVVRKRSLGIHVCSAASAARMNTAAALFSSAKTSDLVLSAEFVDLLNQTHPLLHYLWSWKGKVFFFAEVYCNKKATSPGLEARGWMVKSRRLCSLAAPELQLFQSISGCCIHDKSVKPASLDVCALLDSVKNNVNLKLGMFISAFFLHHLGSEMQTCSVRLHAPSAITANFDLLHFFKYCHHNSNNSRLQCINRCRSARSAWRCYHFPFQLVPNCLGILPVW